MRCPNWIRNGVDIALDRSNQLYITNRQELAESICRAIMICRPLPVTASKAAKRKHRERLIKIWETRWTNPALLKMAGPKPEQVVESYLSPAPSPENIIDIGDDDIAY